MHLTQQIKEVLEAVKEAVPPGMSGDYRMRHSFALDDEGRLCLTLMLRPGYYRTIYLEGDCLDDKGIFVEELVEKLKDAGDL